MKSWFVFLIDENNKIGTWANSVYEAKKNIVAEYGDVPMKFIGINYDEFGPQPEIVTHYGMSAVDVSIAYGFANMLIGLRYMR